MANYCFAQAESVVFMWLYCRSTHQRDVHRKKWCTCIFFKGNMVPVQNFKDEEFYNVINWLYSLTKLRLK